MFHHFVYGLGRYKVEINYTIDNIHCKIAAG